MTPEQIARMKAGREAKAKFRKENPDYVEPQKPGMRAAINAMCKHCIVDDRGGGGTWRQQTEACTSYQCPLYEMRPKSTNSNAP